MSSPISHWSPDGGSSGLRVLILLCSLGLNVGLGAWLFLGAQRRVALGIEATPAPSTFPRSQRVVPIAPNPPIAKPPPFHWSEIESSSYPEYIARLRAVGCPEDVLRDIVAADIVQLFKSRARAIWHRPTRPYWSKSNETDRPTPQQLAQLMELDKDRQQVQKALLGTATRQQELIDLAFAQVHGSEYQLAWLPEEKRIAAMAALEKSGWLADEERQMLRENGERTLQQAETLARRQEAILQNVLSPDELKEFRIRSSQQAGTLQGELKYFDATQQEFDAILGVREKLAQDKSLPQDFYKRKAAECAAVRGVLGAERAAEYERSTDLFYVWARQAAEHYGLDEDVAVKAWEVKRTTLADADEIRSNRVWTEDEKRRRLTDLKLRAERQLETTLGPSALRFARKGDGVWLQILPQRTQP